MMRCMDCAPGMGEKNSGQSCDAAGAGSNRRKRKGPGRETGSGASDVDRRALEGFELAVEERHGVERVLRGGVHVRAALVHELVAQDGEDAGRAVEGEVVETAGPDGAG